MKTIIYSIILISLLCSASVLHPMHISYTKVQIEQKQVRLLVKVFSDDVLLAAETFFEKKNISESDIIKYILHHCKVQVNSRLCDFSFEKERHEDNASWYFFVAKMQCNDCKFRVTNSIMCNVFDDQKNIVILSCNSQEKGFNLDYTTRSCEF